MDRIVKFGKHSFNEGHPKNKVRTTKYTLLTWAPKSLFMQFKRAANIYFLVVSVLSFMPFSPKNPFSLAVTFSAVLFFTMLKEAYEDYYRHKQDNQVNQMTCHRLDPVSQQVTNIQSQEVKLGDILLVQDEEFIPADMVLLSSQNSKGLAFVNTMNLDGESNLKEKVCLNSTQQLNTPKKLAEASGELKCDQPNPSLVKWHCLFNQSEVMGLSQLLLRGCLLKNSDYVYGVVVYSGSETKIMLNSKDPPSKVSNVFKRMNKMLYFLLGIQLATCGVFGQLSCVWNYYMEPHTYIPNKGSCDFVSLTESVLMYWVAYSHLIPISLYVALEIVKLAQSFLMSKDLDMYYQEEDRPASCRTSDLVEELGQVEFVFSDKTGTLTRNQMVFKKCFVGGLVYSDNSALKNTTLHLELKEFFLQLSMCHSVFASGSKTIEYQSSSPDELALVEASASVGYRFTDRSEKTIQVETPQGLQTWRLLAEIPFDYSRKRMSVLVKEPLSEKVYLMTKGADSIMMSLLEDNTDLASLDQKLNEFAKEGLRTLVLAKRQVPAPEANNWLEKWENLLKANSDEKELHSHAEAIEKNLKIVGVSAVEDKLQEGVPETIALLISANVRVWMLTGDKQQTAVEIAKSCNLIQESMAIVKLSSYSCEQFQRTLEASMHKFSLDNYSLHQIQNLKNTEKVALVIDGNSLVWALEDKTRFLKLCLFSSSCIICRVSPAQKMLVVQLVKSQGDWITLAIGDGANDVSMIQEAHIGVGICGKEGTQAVQASDYSVAQFQYLSKMLLVHGKWGYRRISYFICYYFYKNIVAVTCEVWFAFFNGFSGQIYFADFLPMLYNAVWTSWPCMLTYIFEQDLSAKDCYKHPCAFKEGQKNYYFTAVGFWKWILLGIFHGAVCFWLPFAGLDSDLSGKDLGLWATSTISFTLVIHVVSYKLFMETVFVNAINLSAGAVCVAVYYLSIFLLNTDSVALLVQPQLNQVFFEMFSIPGTWLVLFFAPALALLPDFIFAAWRQVFYPSFSESVLKKNQKLKIK